MIVALPELTSLSTETSSVLTLASCNAASIFLPCSSSPTLPHIRTWPLWIDSLDDAMASFRPFPPRCSSNWMPCIVSPPWGQRDEYVTMS
ncbi:hypothetical protein OGAPHI_006659 [Ogataea philodendri]|uniref:Uncharacterized protein n=1 Tax=Ogataea philodendri TaxID=1378263 RepID=A0A9P8NXI8_9ASCO|nr:uncharacterized protein OGAPHI_006659 [Ogataea philodendri]KAH3661252.1 hypothetical protein OGAPHI_006659 [Ogataea philodendri]